MKLISILGTLLLGFIQMANAQPGRITGKVLSARTGEVLIGATISVPGNRAKVVQSDQNGQYTLSGLSAGTYTLVCTYVSKKSNRIENIKVVANDVTTLDFVMEEAGRLTEVEVKAAPTATKARESVSSLIIAQKNRASVSDGISQESIKRTPDRSVSDVLKRVTGASIQDEKFVIVRGLNDRYNASFLNGAALPSSEDNRKAFAFNIFPANAIDNLVIQKTATPDMPGEFAGGLINIETKSIPSKNFKTLSVSLGYNTITTFRDRMYYRGGRWDFLGIDNGVRGVPERFPDQLAYQNLSNRELVAASKTFPNYWQLFRGNTLPNLAFQYTVGHNFQRKQRDFLGVLFSLTYNRSTSNNAGETNGFEINQSNPGQFGLLEQTKRFPLQEQTGVNTLFGVMANASLKLNNNNTFSFKNILSMNGDDRVITREGLDDVVGGNDILSRASAFWFTSNVVVSSQLIGEHYHPKSKIKINWLASLTNVDRNMPSLRTMKYRQNGAGAPWEAVIGGFTNEGGGNILFFKNTELGKNVRVDLSRSFNLGKLIRNQFKAGFYYQTRDRDFESRKLNYNRYTFGGLAFDVNLLQLPQERIFDPRYMGPQPNGKGGFFIDDATQPEDSYRGFSELYAYYAMMDQRIGKPIRLIYGARIEDFRLNFFSARLGATQPISVNTRKQDVLPSANLVISPGQKHNIRFSYSRTLNRPEFLELAPFLFYDFTTRLLVSGRETNQRASVDNYDVRYEFFPGRAQLFSVSAFHKRFTDPIELRFLPGVSTQAEYVNLPSAEVTGFEAEGRLLLGSLFPRSKGILEKLTIYGNYTMMESDLVLTTDTTQTRFQSNRPMQGQSPYVINGGITYADDNRGWSSTLSLNRVGPRIYITGNGQDGDYDIIEAPRTVVDFQLAKNISNNQIELKLNIRDILAQNRYLFYDINANQKFERQRDQILVRNNFGQVISMSLTYKFL